MSDYKYAFKRLDKLRKTIEQLVNQNTELREANSKLRQSFDSYEQRDAARERLLRKQELQTVGDPSEIKRTEEEAEENLDSR